MDRSPSGTSRHSVDRPCRCRLRASSAALGPGTVPRCTVSTVTCFAWSSIGIANATVRAVSVLQFQAIITLSPIFSGGLGGITRQLWTEPEAERFAAIARAAGVPADRILVENRSTNTGENVAFTRALLAERGMNPRSFILVQKPYMERRTFATFRKVWPEMAAIVTSPRVSFEEYLARYSNAALSERDVIGIMVGDLQRIREYPARGFQVEQDIPDDVWDAFQRLVELGYDSHLIAASK